MILGNLIVDGFACLGFSGFVLVAGAVYVATRVVGTPAGKAFLESFKKP